MFGENSIDETINIRPVKCPPEASRGIGEAIASTVLSGVLVLAGGWLNRIADGHRLTIGERRKPIERLNPRG